MQAFKQNLLYAFRHFLGLHIGLRRPCKWKVKCGL